VRSPQVNSISSGNFAGFPVESLGVPGFSLWQVNLASKSSDKGHRIMSTVKVSIPATSANLGPGFDSMGLALGLSNSVEITETDDALTVDIQGEGAGATPENETNLIVQAAYTVFRRLDYRPRGLHFTLSNVIPLASGLGSSAASLVGGMVAANCLLDQPLSGDELLALAVEAEGHPDNVCPAFLGGLVISSYLDDHLTYHKMPIKPMEVALVLPAIRSKTHDMRAILPKSVLLTDAAANIGRAVMVAHALSDGDYDLLADAMQDRLHEPYRRASIPGFDQAVEGALEAGAAAVALSGAGPSLIAFAPSGHARIAGRMADILRATTGLGVRSWVLPVDTHGLVINGQEGYQITRRQEGQHRLARVGCQGPNRTG
jgi:homoserine kinase